MSNSVEKLVNAFNLNNYFCDRVNTNFTVEGRKIVGLFADDTDVAEYLHRIGEEIIKQQYSSREVAGKYYNLNYFPFVLGANPSKKKSDIKGVMEVKLADSANREVIRNLKIHLVNEFRRAVILKLIARLQKAVGITEEKAHEWVGKTFGIAAIGKSSSYLYCIAFSDEYLKRRYDSETFELLKEEYIKEFNSRLENCGLKVSDFYEYKDDMLYIKNVSDKVVKSVAEYERGRVALDFETPGTEDSKVENFKDVLGDFIFQWIGKPINAYGYDIFADEGEIGSGNSFVLIPLTKACDGQLESLKHKDAYKINAVYNKKLISDIRGKTAKPYVTNCQNLVYAFSNKQIACLLPIIMESPIAYNKRNGRFEFAVDLTNFKRRGSSRSSSTVNSPTHAGQSGLRTPPNQRKADSGYDSNSPPKPKDSVAHSSSGDPGPSSKISHSQVSPPSQGSMLRHNLGAAEVGAAESGSAGTSAWTQQTNPWLSQGTSGNKWQPLQFTEPGFSGSSWTQSSSELSSWKGANKSGSAWTSTRGSYSSPPPLIPSSGGIVPRFRLPVSFTSTRDPGSSPPPFIPSSGGIVPRFRSPIQVSSSEPSSSKGANESMPAGASVSKGILENKRQRPTSVYSADSGYSGSLEQPQSQQFTKEPSGSSQQKLSLNTVPGVSESGEDPSAAAVHTDNKRPQSLMLAGFSTHASNKTVKAFLYFLDYFSSPEGKKQLPLLLSSEAGKQLSSISDPREQENLLDFLFFTEGKEQLCSLFSSENKQQLHSLFSLKGKELLFSPSPEGQKLIPLVLSSEGKEQLPLLLSPEGERISKPFSPEAGNIMSLLIYSHVEPKNMSHRSFRDKLAKWLHRNSSLSKVASLQEKPLTNDEKKELRPFLCPKLQKKLDSNSLENPQLIYLLYTPGGKKKLDLLLSSPEEEGKQLHSDLPFEAKKELLPEFFDKQGISCNASTSSEESGIFSLSQNSTNSVLSNFNNEPVFEEGPSVNANPTSSVDDVMVEHSSRPKGRWSLRS